MERRFAGVLLLVVGAVLAFGALGVFTISVAYLWPLFLLFPGLMFHVRYFFNPGKGQANTLVPGGILTVYGTLFLVCNFFGWELMHDLWPVFLLGPAVGLFELYLFGGRNPSVLVPVSVLTVIAVLFLGFNVLSGMTGAALGIILVLVGLWSLFGRGIGRGNNKGDSFFK